MICEWCKTNYVPDEQLCACHISRMYIEDAGYIKEVEIQGVFGASELAMHHKIVTKKGVIALVRPDDEHMNYAYVLCENGHWYGGSFHLFEDGRFSLS